jgi:hypothetical protein
MITDLSTGRSEAWIFDIRALLLSPKVNFFQ